MGSLRQFLVLAVFVVGVSSLTTRAPPKTTVTSPTPSSAVSSSTADPLAVNEETPQADSVTPSASVGNVETPAVVEEVSHDWTDGFVPVEGYYVEEEEPNHTPEDPDLVFSYHEHPEYPGDYYYDENYEYSDYYDPYSYSESEAPTQEEFEDNIPESLHADQDIIINRDNLVPITKTLILAITGKENPTYSELIKAGAITAFKTSLKHLGDEKLSVNLLDLAKKITTMWNDGDDNEGDEEGGGEEEDDFLSRMAEDFLGSHRFKLVLPESVLLHEKELKELLAKRMNESEGEARSASSETSQLTIFMPRAEPGISTVLSLSPVPWITLFTGLLSIPYFLSSDDTPSPVARADRPGRLPLHAVPFRQLRPPGLPFVQNQQLRRDHKVVPPQNQPIDQEFFEYKKKYAQWYNQWYLKHKDYYDKNYPFNPQAQGQIRPPPVGPAQRLPPRPAGGPQRQVVPPRKTRPPQQRPRTPPQKKIQRPHPQARVPSKRRRVHPHRPIPAGKVPRPALPPGQGARNNAPTSSISVISEPHPNSFGTFHKEGNHGDSHFRVFRGPDVSTSPTTVPPPSKVPSPQPVYIPTTKAVPTTETGFKPIIKPDSPLEDQTISQSLSESVLIPKQVKPNFRPPKQEDLLDKTKSSSVPKKKPDIASGNVQLAPGSFKPLPGSVSVAPQGEPESTTRKVSAITSSIFKTAPTTQAPPVTSPAAVFFRTATQKSVRVVTSKSVVTNPAVALPQKQQLQDVQSKRHQGSHSVPQSIDVSASLQSEESRPTVVIEAVPVDPQPFKAPQEPPSAAPGPVGLSRGVVRTNVPTSIRVVDNRDHRRPQGFGLGPKPTEVSDKLKTKENSEAPDTPTTTPVPIFALDPFYGSRLSRIDVIFHQLKVEGEGCREQVVCNIYKNPEVFTPFSDFLSRQLTVTLEELRRPKVSDERILRFFRYLKAARDGQDGVDCLARYSQCAQDTNALSHKPIITTYQKVSRLMDVSVSP